MASTTSVSADNCLLSALPRQDRDRLLAQCEPVELTFAELLYRAGEPILQVYLPAGSVISQRAPAHDGPGLEVALIGNEGLLGSTLLLDVETAPFDARVQGPGPAWRIETSSFRREFQHCHALQTLLKRYLYVSMSQLAQAAFCHRFHVLEARLARWLLMNQDRAHADTFQVTQVAMAAMLGVRRVGITKAAHLLQQQKLIRYHRGMLTILDRPSLEACCCGCYQADNRTYRRILGWSHVAEYAVPG